MRSRFEPDRQLTARMAVTMFLLGLMYVAFIAALIVLLKSVVLVVVIAAGLLAAQYWYSDRIALNPMRGRLVTAEERPRLHGVIDRLYTTADMPEPQVTASDTDCPTRSPPAATPTTPSSASPPARASKAARLPEPGTPQEPEAGGSSVRV
jgi:heat shock protein HtpX